MSHRVFGCGHAHHDLGGKELFGKVGLDLDLVLDARSAVLGDDRNDGEWQVDVLRDAVPVASERK